MKFLITQGQIRKIHKYLIKNKRFENFNITKTKLGLKWK